MLLQQATEPLLNWPDVPIELLGFLLTFGTLGALGFRYVVARPLLAQGHAVATEALDGAARIGLTGALLGMVALAAATANTAAEKHLAMSAVIARGGGMLIAQVVLLVIMAVAFGLAARRLSAAWPVALVAALALALRNIVSLKWTQMVNPLHVAGGSLWIGTLFVLFAAGVPAAMRSLPPGEKRGRAVADLVNAFSPLALIGGALLASMGVVTAVRHLKRVDALWTTPYGWTFLVKLLLVLVVFALGAWNWRRMRPALGEERAAVLIQRSARAELCVATAVLVVTAVLVALPSPR